MSAERRGTARALALRFGWSMFRSCGSDSLLIPATQLQTADGLFFQAFASLDEVVDNGAKELGEDDYQDPD